MFTNSDLSHARKSLGTAS